MAGRRSIARDELFENMRHPRAADERSRCHHTIVLDGIVYRCGRGHLDGIHDAFATHRDGGEVRW